MREQRRLNVELEEERLAVDDVEADAVGELDLLERRLLGEELVDVGGEEGVGGEERGAEGALDRRLELLLGRRREGAGGGVVSFGWERMGGCVGRVYVLNMATRRGTRLVRVDGRWLFSCRTESRVPDCNCFCPAMRWELDRGRGNSGPGWRWGVVVQGPGHPPGALLTPQVTTLVTGAACNTIVAQRTSDEPTRKK